MQLAKPLKANPRQLASSSRRPAGHAACAVGGRHRDRRPGLLNIRLKPAAKQQVVREVLAQARASAASRRGENMMVEFVSANPTGPLHVGHGRQAALGDAICNLFPPGLAGAPRVLLQRRGRADRHPDQLGAVRAKGLKPGDAGWPEAAYNGDYIQDIADDFLAGKTVRPTTASSPPTATSGLRQHPPVRRGLPAPRAGQGPAGLQPEVRRVLPRVQPVHQRPVEATVQKLIAAGKTYEQDGALWLRTTDYGDDKDRVMRKSDGGYTYFVPDVAYHISKWERGFTRSSTSRAPTTTAPSPACAPACRPRGHSQGYPDYVLHTMVRVVRGGEEVKISKRAGSYVTLRDLIEWTSKDAVRFFLLSRKPDTEYTFDVDLAVPRTTTTRCTTCSTRMRASARCCGLGRRRRRLAGADLSALDRPRPRR
jgi:arginyl-tRNA synthetase